MSGYLVEDKVHQRTIVAMEQPPKFATRAYAERFSWDKTTAGQLKFFRALRDDGRRLRQTPPGGRSPAPFRSLASGAAGPGKP